MCPQVGIFRSYLSYYFDNKKVREKVTSAEEYRNILDKYIRLTEAPPQSQPKLCLHSHFRFWLLHSGCAHLFPFAVYGSWAAYLTDQNCAQTEIGLRNARLSAEIRIT